MHPSYYSGRILGPNIVILWNKTGDGADKKEIRGQRLRSCNALKVMQLFLYFLCLIEGIHAAKCLKLDFKVTGTPTLFLEAYVPAGKDKVGLLLHSSFRLVNMFSYFTIKRNTLSRFIISRILLQHKLVHHIQINLVAFKDAIAVPAAHSHDDCLFWNGNTLSQIFK